VALIAAFERAIVLTAWTVCALYVTGVLSDVTAWLEATPDPAGQDDRVALGGVHGRDHDPGEPAGCDVARFADRIALDGHTGPGSQFPGCSGRIVRAILMLVALLASLELSGIDLTVLSVFGGALGVGLGLGLQRIAATT